MAIEIERKWLILDGTTLPASTAYFRVEHIRQAYIINKDRHVMRVRLSDITNPFGGKMALKHFKEATVTVKGPSDGEYADEYEMKIPFSFGEKFIEGLPILGKMRRSFKLGSRICEVDTFKGRLSGLIIVEIEFSTLAESKDFVAPDWFNDEVTNDSNYSNANLYKKIGGE